MIRSPDHVPERAYLRFAEEVKVQFRFLLKLGFTFIRSEASFVRFESPDLAVNIYHGRLSYEIGLEIEFKGEINSCFGISRLLRLINYELYLRYRQFATRSEEGVVTGVRQLSEMFRYCIDMGILDNKRQLLSRLREFQAIAGHEMAVKYNLPGIRSEAATAWRNKDFRLFIDLLTPYKDDLTLVEIKKMEYASRHLSV